MKYIRFALILAGLAWTATVNGEVGPSEIASASGEERLRAVSAVNRTADAQVLAALERRLRDPAEDVRVRLQAARALLLNDYPGSREQMDVLISAVATEEIDGADNIAVSALAPKGDEAVTALTSYYDRGEIDMKFYRAALSRIGTPAAREIVTRLDEEWYSDMRKTEPGTFKTRQSGYYNYRTRNPENK